MASPEWINDLKRLKELSALEAKENPSLVLGAQILLSIREMLRAMPEDQRLNLAEATVDQVWELAKRR